MAVTVSLINMKGGVGKSTLTINLAWSFSLKSDWGKRVLVVDLDPQFNASQYLVGPSNYKKILEKKNPTIWDIFEEGTRTPRGKVSRMDPRSAIAKFPDFPSGGCLHLIPSRLELAFSLKNPRNKEHRLSNLLKKIKDSYDLILIDCAPTESILTTAAYLSSEWLLVPVKPEYLSTIGLPLLVSSMQDFKEEYENSNLQLAGVVFNAVSDYSPEEALAKRAVREIAQINQWHVFSKEVEFSRSYSKGAREGQPIFRTSYARWDKIHNFEKVAEEIASRIGL